MTNFLRLTSAAAALALTASPALAASPTVNPDKQATATARVVKPLTLTWVQDLDLGTILQSGAGTWTGAAVGISRAGVSSCTNGNVVCSGTMQVAKYHVTGTNNQTVQVNASNVTLVNQLDSTKSLLLTTDSPGTIVLPNSGTSGTDFALGGTISVDSSTLDGTYAGTFAVTVNY